MNLPALAVRQARENFCPGKKDGGDGLAPADGERERESIQRYSWCIRVVVDSEPTPALLFQVITSAQMLHSLYPSVSPFLI